MTTQPCNMCGRPVASFFDHVDVDCLNWPAPDAPLPVKYRDYEVDTTMFQCMGAMYGYVHKDYDGAPDAHDNRHGTEATLEDCYRAIDESYDA